MWIADAKVVELDKARERVREVIGRTDGGADPALADEQALTVFRDFVADYLARGKVNWKARVYEGKKRFLETQLVPRWGDLALSDIQRRHVLEQDLRAAAVERGSAPPALDTSRALSRRTRRRHSDGLDLSA